MIAILAALLLASTITEADAKGWRTSRGHTAVKVVKRNDPPFWCLYSGQSYYTQKDGWRICTDASPAPVGR